MRLVVALFLLHLSFHFSLCRKGLMSWLLLLYALCISPIMKRDQDYVNNDMLIPTVDLIVYYAHKNRVGFTDKRSDEQGVLF